MGRLAVLGQPIGHSRSPAMHTAAFEALGMQDEWSYDAIEVGPEGFAERVRAMAQEGFEGANVTVPHKRAALEVADGSSRVAGEIGAANTLSFSGGSIRADNTDAAGLVAALPGQLTGRRALVLGAGGAARAAVWALLREGAEVSIWNRTTERAGAIAAEIGGDALDPGGERPAAGGYDLIVNCTAVGLQGEDPFAHLPLEPGSLRRGQVVADLVYGDSETKLVRAAREAGAEAVDGLEVLVHQGAASFRIWTGVDPPLDAMRDAARSI